MIPNEPGFPGNSLVLVQKIALVFIAVGHSHCLMNGPNCPVVVGCHTRFASWERSQHATRIPGMEA